MTDEYSKKITEAFNSAGVTVEELSGRLKLFTDAMLRIMAIEMIKYGYCTLANGKVLYIEDASERFLEIYEEELSDKMEVLSREEK